MRHGVILAGGGGTRLWPASRRERPKPLLPLSPGGESLLAATVRRSQRAVGPTLVVTAAEQESAIREALGPGGAEIVTEPAMRNTAAAIGLAAVLLRARDPDALMAVFPADHHVADEDAFTDVVGRALDAAEATGALVSIGVVPTRAETGFGYLELGGERGAGVRVVRRFVEKPDAAAARSMVAGGGHLWNAGIFAARAARLLEEIERHLPATGLALAAIAAALGPAPGAPGSTGAAGAPDLAAAARRTAEVYPTLQAISIDHGVLEKTGELLCVPGSFGWNDVGAWDALAEIMAADASGNVVRGEAALVDARGNIAVGDPGRVIALVGVEDLVVVQSGDAVLVVPRARAQEVRAAVAALEAAGLERFL